jgi:RNA polymerase sigma-70 factor (ECF subfamily)
MNTGNPFHSSQDAAHRAKQDRFMLLLRPLYKRLERFALTMTKNRDDAKDIVGETVLLAYEHLEQLRSDEAFLGFLFTIASRVSQKRSRRRQEEPATEEQVEELFDNFTQPDVALDVQFLYEAMDKLPAEQREAVVLAEITGLSHKEIQKIQGGTVSGVKVRIFRAKRKLAQLLGVEKKSVVVEEE